MSRIASTHVLLPRNFLIFDRFIPELVLVAIILYLIRSTGVTLLDNGYTGYNVGLSLMS